MVVRAPRKSRYDFYFAEEVPAPRDYFLGPLFAATPQTGPRERRIGNKSYLVGGFHPLIKDYPSKALDVRHARAIFTMLSFWDPYSNSRRIQFSLNEFCRRYARSNGGRYFRDVRSILGELLNTYIQVTDLETREFHQYRLIDYVDICGKVIKRSDSELATTQQKELWFNGCDLSEEFFGLLGRVAELMHLKLAEFTSIRSPLAQAIYLYIPSRAYHHSEAQPFQINLAELLRQVSFRVPETRHRRRQIFVQHEKEGRSILQQLDGRETISGRFRVSLAETKDGEDWKLLAWLEKRPKAKFDPAKSKLAQDYLESGRPPEYLEQARKNIDSLTDHELYLLEKGNIEVEKNIRFFEWAKALLGTTRFVELLSGAKSDELEGRKATKTPTARLIFRIREAVRTPPKLATPTR